MRLRIASCPRLAACALAAAIALAAPPSAHAELPPLIPRAVLFGEPRYGGLTVSPDGTRLMWHERDSDGLPRRWINRVKRGIQTLGWRFNADRMVMDYTMHCYLPAASGCSGAMIR